MSELTVVLKESGLKRFKSGHPWVFKNDAFPIRARVSPGSWCKLEDEHHNFLARGFLNLEAQIIFREWTRLSTDVDPLSCFKSNLAKARERRRGLKQNEWSHRVLFSEGDNASGLIVDRYLLESKKRVFVAQVLTAGAESISDRLYELLELNSATDILIIHRSAASRKREGLRQVKPVVSGSAITPEELSAANVLFASASANVGDPLVLSVDLLGGQKTGFFLDQFDNIQTTLGLLPKFPGKDVRIVDLFCYLGHWGLQIGIHLKNLGYNVHVDLVDISEKALKKASENLARYGISSRPVKIDFVKDGKSLKENYDVVILDPPALIKSKKDRLLGLKAYHRVNDWALARTKNGGAFVSCSCSYNLSEQDLQDLLKESTRKTGKQVAWVAQGWQAKDHPIRPGFPEGSYLKAYMGLSR